MEMEEINRKNVFCNSIKWDPSEMDSVELFTKRLSLEWHEELGWIDRYNVWWPEEVNKEIVEKFDLILSGGKK